MARQCEIHKREPTDAERSILAARPLLDPLLETAVMLVVEAWFDCSADRALGFGAVGDIPTLAIRAWAKDEGWDRETRRFLVRVIRCVDAWRSEREASKRRLDP